MIAEVGPQDSAPGLAIRMDDGTKMVAGPADITYLPSGHDAWVVAEEEAAVVDVRR